jgi:hypothetical protein
LTVLTVLFLFLFLFLAFAFLGLVVSGFLRLLFARCSVFTVRGLVLSLVLIPTCMMVFGCACVCSSHIVEYLQRRRCGCGNIAVDSIHVWILFPLASSFPSKRSLAGIPFAVSILKSSP